MDTRENPSGQTPLTSTIEHIQSTLQAGKRVIEAQAALVEENLRLRVALEEIRAWTKDVGRLPSGARALIPEQIEIIANRALMKGGI
jgi:hypothetical protein